MLSRAKLQVFSAIYAQWIRGMNPLQIADFDSFQMGYALACASDPEFTEIVCNELNAVKAELDLAYTLEEPVANL